MLRVFSAQQGSVWLLTLMTSRPASSSSSSSSSFKSWLSLAAGAVLLGLGGCASVKQAPAGEDASAKRFEAPAGLSRIYIYRNEFLGTLVGLDLSVDGQVAGTTKGKTFVIADVPPGEHESSPRARTPTSSASAPRSASPASSGKRSRWACSAPARACMRWTPPRAGPGSMKAAWWTAR